MYPWTRGSIVPVAFPDQSPAVGLVLVVDDDPSFAALVADLLGQQGYRTDTASDHAQAMAQLAQADYAVAVVDLMLPGGSGLDLANTIRAQNPETQVLILTGHSSLPSAIAGIRQGVFDYLEKRDLDLDRLGRAVESASERWRLLRENRHLMEALQENNLRLQALHEATSRLAGGEHADRILADLVDSTRALLGVERARVTLFERGHDGTLLVSGAEGDGAGVLHGVRLHAQEGIAARVATTGRPVRRERAQDDPAFFPRADDLEASGEGFVCVAIRQGSILGALSAAGRAEPLTERDQHFASSLAMQAATALEKALQSERSVNFFTHTCNILVSFLETKDVHLPGHSRAVAALADMVTRRLGLPDPQRRSIHFGALLHDIGKVLLEPDLLEADQLLTHDQLIRMRDHAALGVELLKPITLWEDMLPLIQTHHERWDGRGYPSNLSGEDIPLGARVIAVADAFDAMTRGYPGRPARTAEEALGELQAGAGSQFDPRIVRLFVAEYREHAPA
jgi:putative nucleotidyltransferase with HDIG domain